MGVVIVYGVNCGIVTLLILYLEGEVMERPTVGKLAYDLSAKEPESRDPIELEREMHKDYEQHIYQCIERGKSSFADDFYIIVITKKEPLMPNVLRNYFSVRLSCPTPDYDQTVYRYHRVEDKIEFLWVVPSRDTCFVFKDNALQIAPEERGLLEYVLAFADGTLFKLAKKLNGEQEVSPVVDKG